MNEVPVMIGTPMKHLTLITVMSASIAACSTPAALKINPGEYAAENNRTIIAKMVLQTPAGGSMSIIEAKMVNAQISQPEVRRRILSDETYTYYCVQAEIENPLFPLNQGVQADVEVTERNGKNNYRVRSRFNRSCTGSNLEPFREIEELSRKRYSQES